MTAKVEPVRDRESGVGDGMSEISFDRRYSVGRDTFPGHRSFTLENDKRCTYV